MDTFIEHTLGVLDTEKINPATAEIDRMSSLEIVQVINAEDAKVAQAVKQVLPQIARSTGSIVKTSDVEVSAIDDAAVLQRRKE